jgi:biopolymer transport protein ExbD
MSSESRNFGGPKLPIDFSIISFDTVTFISVILVILLMVMVAVIFMSQDPLTVNGPTWN